MSTAVMTKPIAEESPLSKARIAGVFYLFTFLAGGAALFIRGMLGLVLVLIASACYVAVTLLFYYIFKPVNRRLSLLAALISLAGCAIGTVTSLISPLIFFGFYCLLIGYLIFKSTFLPRFIGVLMAFAGVGWLTFLWPPLANYLSPYNMIPGMIGEGALTVWLLIKGVSDKSLGGIAGRRSLENANFPNITASH